MRSSALATTRSGLVFCALFAFCGLAGCSGGSYPGTSGQGGEGTGTGTPAPSSSGDTSPSRGSSGSPSDSTSSPAPSSSPSSAPSGDVPSTPPSTPPASTGPRPECVAFANHQCACNGSHASATCNKDLADGCENGVQLCANQLTWYTCVTANACGTSACTQPSGC